MPSEEQDQMVPAPVPKVEGVIVATPSATAIIGGPGTGKSEKLVVRVKELLDSGTDPAQILVFTATPDAATTFSQRLQRVAAAASDVRVTTPRAWCLQLLETPEAEMATGRDARLLAPFEYDFLMEDLKVSGMRTKRIREMMKFFYKSITELADDEEGNWLITNEETSAFGMLKNCLGFTRGVIEPELANLCVRFLQRDPLAKAKAQVAHVLVDDYQMLSRASQTIANLLATESICIATDPETCVEVFESYPYAGGLDEFLEANSHVERIDVSQSFSCTASAHAVNMMRADMAIVAEPLDASLCGGNAEIHEIASETPGDEMQAAADYVAQLVADGMDPSQVIVASPHRTVSANLARALADRGVETELAQTARVVSGDIRAEEKCTAARVLTALYLVANANDGVAWRSWCGFGDWLTHSNVVHNLRDFGGQNGMAIDAALAAAESQMDVFDNAESVSGTKRVVDAYNTALGIIEQAYGKQGRPLLEFLARSVLGQGAEVPAAVLQLTAAFPDGRLAGDDAKSMAARARARLDTPAFETNNTVHITTYERMCGQSPDALLLCGFVNGFFPIRDYFDRVAMPLDKAEKQHERDTRLMHAVAGKPNAVLAISHFSETQLEAAEMLKLKIHRICLKDKRRVALIEPSEFLHKFKA